MGFATKSSPFILFVAYVVDGHEKFLYISSHSRHVAMPSCSTEVRTGQVAVRVRLAAPGFVFLHQSYFHTQPP